MSDKRHNSEIINRELMREDLDPEKLYGGNRKDIKYSEEHVNALRELVSTKNMKDQAIQFLNAFPEIIDTHGDKIQQEVKLINEIINDPAKRQLESLDCHRFFEKIGIEMSHLNFSKTFEQIDIDKSKTLSQLEILMHFEDKTLHQLLDAPQVSAVPDEEFKAQMKLVQAEIDIIRAKIKEIEDKKAEYVNIIESGTNEDGTFTMKAKIAIQELHAMVHSEDIILELEAKIRKSAKKIKEITTEMAKKAEQTSLGERFWISKELDEMVKQKPGANIADKLKAWGN